MASTVRTRRGFTLMEMLVVIAIMIALLSLLIVGLNRATGGAQEANTRALMNSIRQALVTFEKDIGYLPPILDENRNFLAPPALPANPSSPSVGDRIALQQWASETSLPEYLIGYGTRPQDGYGDESSGEWPPTGIRHPDFDGVWRATLQTGGFNDRDPVPPEAGGTAQKYGPYLALDNDNLLASTQGERDDDGQLIVYLPGENGYSADDPRVIVDYWGSPIQYVRRSYPAGNPGQEWRAVDRNGDGVPDEPPSLANVYRLRPWTVNPNGAIDGWPDFSNDTTTTPELKGSRFALFSPGPDRIYEWRARVGQTEKNADNIVEFGP